MESPAAAAGEFLDIFLVPMRRWPPSDIIGRLDINHFLAPMTGLAVGRRGEKKGCGIHIGPAASPDDYKTYHPISLGLKNSCSNEFLLEPENLFATRGGERAF